MSSTERRHRYIPVLQPRLYDPFEDGETEPSAEVKPINEKILNEEEDILREFQTLAQANRIRNFREDVDPNTADWTVKFSITPETQVIFQKGANRPTEVIIQPKLAKPTPEVRTYSGEVAQKISEIWYDLHPKLNE